MKIILYFESRRLRALQQKHATVLTELQASRSAFDRALTRSGELAMENSALKDKLARQACDLREAARLINAVPTPAARRFLSHLSSQYNINP